MIKKLLICSMTFFSIGLFYGQQVIEVGTVDYNNAKANGTLGLYNVVSPLKQRIRPSVSPLQVNRTPTECFGYIPPNPGIPPQNMPDDGSLLPISLPFSFCMYGQNYNTCYINANGNVTFSSANGSYSSSGFPSTTNNPMLAPFWADIEMGPQGNAYYEVFPNAVVINWENCGYFNNHVDKTVTFQLIFTDGTSPLLSGGNNVGFFYEDMNWTTGDASGGTNGFGGTPMTVGVNQGNGVDFIQLGRFDAPGNAYDGPFGNNDGIDWLDNKYFMFNVCNSDNIPPIVNGIQVCDTLRICLGDSLPINFDVLAVEQSQTAGIIIDTTGVVGYNEINYTPGLGGVNGNPASLSAYFRPTTVDTLTIGINYFDNGTPVDTLTMDLIIIVDTLPYNPILSSDTTVCIGELVAVGAGNFFDSYYWTDTLGNNLGVDSVESLPVGWNYLEVSINGCVDHDSIFIESFPDNTPIVIGDLVYCAPDSVLLRVDTIPTVSYTWTMNMGVDTISTLDSIYLQSGSYNVSIEDTSGCYFNSDFQVSDFQSFVSIQGNTTYCQGDSVLLTSPPSFDSYTWSSGSTTNTTTAFSGETTLIVSGLNGCLAYDTINILEIIVPDPMVQGQDSICPNGQSILSFTDPGYDSYEWLPSGASINPVVVFVGDYQLAVDYQGCLDTSNVFRVVNAVISDMNMDFESDVCVNDSVFLEPSTSYQSYSWSTGESTSGIYVTGPGTYTLDVVDGNGCENDTSIIIGFIDGIPDISTVSEACLGDEIQLDNGTVPDGGGVWGGFGPGDLNFSPNPTFPYPNLTVSEPGEYTIHFTHNLCPLSDTLKVSFFAAPVLTVLEDTIGLCRGESYVVRAITSDPTNTVWTPNFQTGDSAVVFEEGDYNVTLNNFCGVLSTDFYVKVEDCVIPNVITPNGDGQNDYFITSLIESYSDTRLTIFNRWGRKVYDKEQYDNTWNGVNNGGAKLAAGTYYYVLDYDSGNKSEKGFITLIK